MLGAGNLVHRGAVAVMRALLGLLIVLKYTALGLLMGAVLLVSLPLTLLLVVLAVCILALAARRD